MKIYVIDEHVIDDDYHDTSGIFTDLQLAQTVEPMQAIDLMIIKEMVLLDNQFVPTGYSCCREKCEDSKTWSEWIEVNNKAY